MNYTINQFRTEFKNDDVCLEYIFRKKFNGICPKCKHVNSYYRVRNRKCYACAWCANQIHPTARTIFEKSSTSLQNWFYCIFLFSASRNGLSSNEIKRQLGVTYKTAWRMGKEIRKLMAQETKPTRGIFEADETFIGGRAKLSEKNSNKTAVMGVVKRGGAIYAKAVEDTGRSTLMPIIREHVELGAVLMTDKSSSYQYAGKEFEHHTVIHSKKQYVCGAAHTNTMEGFWSNFKRSVSGTYQYVSSKYLQSYLDEFSFRYNHRNGLIFESLLKRVVG